MSAVNTAKAERRPLRFECIGDLLAEIDRLIAAEAEGRLRCSGNWTLGQAFGHLSTWIDYGYDGYPMRVPWLIRTLIRMRLKKYMHEGMPGGVRIPRVPGGTYGTDVLPTQEGAARLKKSLGRLAAGEPAKYQSPAFGDMSHDDRVTLNLRHAELHLGFVHPE
jgi:hypothetical protein